ncbi:MAG: cyclic nucleotide-binding domain-containing protein [Gemmatimonadales bacterium]
MNSRADLVERLKDHTQLRGVPPEQIAWVATHGRLRHLAAGEVFYTHGDKIDSLHFVLSGHLAIHMDRDAGRRKALEWRGGEVTGLLPYSRLTETPGQVVAEEETELVTVHRDHSPDSPLHLQRFPRRKAIVARQAAMRATR